LSVLAALLAAFLTLAPVAAQDARQPGGRVQLMGRVIDGITREPVRGAFVQLTGSSRQAFTDEQGRFVLKDVPAGARDVRVEQLGYETATVSRTIGDAAPAIEVVLTPDPVLLAQIEVVNDRLARRRNSVTRSVLAYDVERLRSSAAFDAHEFVRQQLFTTPCPRFSVESTCVIRRGRVIAPRIWIDEVRLPGGMAFLRGLSTHDLYLVEIYDAGSQIRVYTNMFARNLAYGRAYLDPVVLF
jgi:hypothetical protein